MQVVAVKDRRKAGVVEKSDPGAKENFAVVRVHAAPMCTEYKAYRSGRVGDVLGHEAAGEVVEVAQPGKVKVGDRVVAMPLYPCGQCALCLAGDYVHCRNRVDPLEICGCEAGTATFAQYMLKADWLLVPIPAGVSYEHGSMACCGLGPTLGAIRLMQVSSFDTILITGMGPVGLGGVINAAHLGARVLAVEGNPFRAELAEKLGAAAVFDPADEKIGEKILELTQGTGVDKAIDCAGVPEAQRLLIDLVRRKGHLAFVAEGGEFPLRISNDMLRKGLTLHGAWHYNLAHAPKIMQVIQDCSYQLDQLITHTFPMSQVQDAWELQLTGRCGKVVLKPWE